MFCVVVQTNLGLVLKLLAWRLQWFFNQRKQWQNTNEQSCVSLSQHYAMCVFQLSFLWCTER